eukprot:m.222024 g.222024  ORF g.222024 m.222024 type:complete len:72 (+) comp15620_c1_seq3:160-375(+)
MMLSLSTETVLEKQLETVGKEEYQVAQKYISCRHPMSPVSIMFPTKNTSVGDEAFKQCGFTSMLLPARSGC